MTFFIAIALLSCNKQQNPSKYVNGIGGTRYWSGTLSTLNTVNPAVQNVKDTFSIDVINGTTIHIEDGFLISKDYLTYDNDSNNVYEFICQSCTNPTVLEKFTLFYDAKQDTLYYDATSLKLNNDSDVVQHLILHTP